MKRVLIAALAVIAISVCLVSSYAGVDIVDPAVRRAGTVSPRSPYLGKDATQPQSLYGGMDRYPDAGRPGYPAPVSPTRPAIDPNKVIAAVRAYAGLEQEIELVGKKSRNEITEWLRPYRTPTSSTTSPTGIDNRPRLAREVQQQVAEELAFLRKIAAQEGAKKTVAAIDGILLARQIRLERLIQKMEEERRRSELGPSRSPQSRTRGRYGSRSTPRPNGLTEPDNREDGYNKGSSRRRHIGPIRGPIRRRPR